MLSGEAFHKINGIIDTVSFYKDEHQKIFNHIKFLSDKDRPIDLITVTQSLKDSQELDEVGGPAYITQITSRVASSANIEFHAKIIQQKFIQRELIRIGTETTTIAYDDNEDIEIMINNLRQSISTIDDYFAGNNTGKSQSEVIKEAIIDIEKDCIEVKQGRQPGINTGFFELNKLTGGWRNSNFIVLASRPSVGKTSLGLHFLKSVTKQNKWVNIYGLEMPSRDLMRVLISSESKVSRTEITNGFDDDSNWVKINNSLSRLEKMKVIWYDYADITSGQIKSNTIRNRKNGKCDFILIDYIQLVTPADNKKIREQQISEISRGLKKLALSENIPIMALAQLNREAENNKPLLSHLRESGSLEQDSDIVIFPWVDKETEQFNLILAKNRRGRIGKFEINRNNEMTDFGDVSFHNEYAQKSYYDQDKF
jgi:replicative DNA helicase